MPENLPAPTEKGKLSAVQVRESGGGGMLLPQTLGEVVTFAQIMAKADLALPAFLRGKEGPCLAVAMQAFRWEMDPFAVANKAYYVNERLAYEAQLIAAVVHMRAPIAKRPEYIYEGEGLGRFCTVRCEMLDGSFKEYTSPPIAKIKVKNSPLWTGDPDQQLGYYAIRSWARRYAPEVILGVYSPDEVAEMRDVTPVRETTGLSAKLAAQQPREGGFRPGVVETALEADFEIIPEDDPRFVQEHMGATSGPDPEATFPEAQEAPEAPEATDVPPAASEAATDDPEPQEDVSMQDMDSDQRIAWTEAFRAQLMRDTKTADQQIAMWKAHWDSHLLPLRETDAILFERLETWAVTRMKRMREREANAEAT